jgi:DNA-binding MarR family transcriptional regulator
LQASIWRAAGVLTTSEMIAILVIRESQVPPNAKAVRDAIGGDYTSASTTGVIESLVRRDLVLRHGDASDRRMIRLFETDKARRELPWKKEFQ